MGLFSNLFSSESKEFKRVKIDQQVIDAVIHYSKKAYPMEFLALFDGFIKEETLYITGLIFLPGETCEVGAVFRSDLLPINTSAWGTVHCHPGPSAMPSDADLATFSKHGLFHMILCLPYSVDTFRAYDKHGNPTGYMIGDYSDLIEEEYDFNDFFDDEDIISEDEVVHAGFFDEEDIILDEQKIDRYAEYEERIANNRPKESIALKVVIDKDGNYKIVPANFNEKF